MFPELLRVEISILESQKSLIDLIPNPAASVRAALTARASTTKAEET